MSDELKKVDCEGVGDNNGFFEIGADSSESASNDLLCCPFCNNPGGFYFKFVETRSIFYSFTGEGCGGSEPNVIQGGKNMYCISCDRDITKIIGNPFVT